MKTLLLDQQTWDLTKDSSGNIALASNPYAIAQDVASACRLFFGELWYDTSQGIPYLQQILGQALQPDLIKSYLAQTAGTVPEVAFAEAFLTRFDGRFLEGQVLIIDVNNNRFIAGSLGLNELPWYINAAYPSAQGFN